MFLIVIILIIMCSILHSKYHEEKDRNDRITGKAQKHDYELIDEIEHDD